MRLGWLPPPRLDGIAAVSGLVLALLASPAEASDWTTFDGNPARAAWLNASSGIGLGNVQRLKLRWVIRLDSLADSTPLLLEHPQGGLHGRPSMVFVTDSAGTSYGIDASSGAIVWRFRTTGIGARITNATGVLDPAAGAVYVPGLDAFVHKLDAATGKELVTPGFPARVSLVPRKEKLNSPLTVANGYLYVATSGYFDKKPYVGHVITVRLADGKTTVFNALCANLHTLLTYGECPSSRAGIWSRSGVVVDPDASMQGRVYVATGNGEYAPAKFDYGDSLVALSADGTTLADTFTPSDYRRLAASDLDLGSTGPAMLPPVANSATPLMAVQGGKSGVLYLVNRAALGGVGGDLQRIPLPHAVLSTPAVWRDAAGRVWVFLGQVSEVRAFTVATSGLGRSRLQRQWVAAVRGTSPVVANGLVFLAATNSLVALDAQTGNVVWSAHNAGGTIGGVHWQSPIVVNGTVFVSDERAKLYAYGLSGYPPRSPAR
jgi:outer membrane protein assembly factor BamB